MSGVDFVNVVNEVVLFVVCCGSKQVECIDFENVRDCVVMGVCRESLVFSVEEK